MFPKEKSSVGKMKFVYLEIKLHKNKITIETILQVC